MSKLNGTSLVAHNVRGLQVGNRNLQVNSFTANIKADAVRINDIVAQPDVKRVLAKMDQRPGDSKAANKADKALAHLRGYNDSVKFAIAKSAHESRVGERGILSGLFLVNSSGVQFGDNLRQNNYFLYTVVPDVSTARLLADSPQLRAGVIQSYSAEGPHASMRKEVASAMDESLRKASLNLADGISRGVVSRPIPDKTTYLMNIDGATFGYDVDQRNKIRAVVGIRHK